MDSPNPNLHRMKEELVDDSKADLSPPVPTHMQGNMPLTPVTPGSLQHPVTPGGAMSFAGMLTPTEPSDLGTMEPVSRNRSNTWPACHSVTMLSDEVPMDISGSVRPIATHNPPKKHTSRKNPWGNRSYADLIADAIASSRGGRATLSQIYDWMVQNIIYFKDKGDSNSSAGWKNSIRHNLSLHNRFMRVQNEGTGKSSWWVINPVARPGKSTRRRSNTIDHSGRPEKKRGRSKKKPIDANMMVRPPQALPTPPSPINILPERVDSPSGSLPQSITGYQPSPQDYRNSSSPLIDERHDSQSQRISPNAAWEYYPGRGHVYDFPAELYHHDHLADSMVERLNIGGTAGVDTYSQRRYHREQGMPDAGAQGRPDVRDYAQVREYAQAQVDHQGFPGHNAISANGYLNHSASHYTYLPGYGACGQHGFQQNNIQLSEMQNAYSNYSMSPPQTVAVQHPLNYSPNSHDGFQQAERSHPMTAQSPYSPSQSSSSRIHHHIHHHHSQSPLSLKSFSPNQTSSSHHQHSHCSQSPAHQASFSSSPISTPATSPILHASASLTQARSPTQISPTSVQTATDQPSTSGFQDTPTSATIRVALTHRNNRSSGQGSATSRPAEGNGNDIEDVDFVHGHLGCNVDEVIRHEMQYNERLGFDFVGGMQSYVNHHGHMQGYVSAHREMTQQLAPPHAAVMSNYSSTIAAAGNQCVR